MANRLLAVSPKVLWLPRWLSGKNIHLPMQETQEMQVQSLVWEDPLEKGMATHSSILAWRIPWTEEPAGDNPGVLQSRTRLSTTTSSNNK